MPRVAASAALATAAFVLGSTLFAQQEPSQVPRFRERVDVTRVIVDVRVLEPNGDPVLGLTADHFKVSIDGKPARVESATWVGEEVPGRPRELPARESAAAPLAPGRLIVFVFQKDLQASRIVGLMKMLIQSRGMLDTLSPHDRVAVLSFDSHLKVWTDFTNDRASLDRVLEHGILFEYPPQVEPASPPSLLERLDPAEGRRTHNIERALELIAEALEPLPGSKSLVLIGYGFGHFSRGFVSMDRDYDSAREALLAARTSVFSLDVTQADYHSLEAGLQLVAEDTGGFYARTHEFAELAIKRLAGALAGYYVLFVEKPDPRRPGEHRIEVKLARGSARVLAGRRYADGPDR